MLGRGGRTRRRSVLGSTRGERRSWYDIMMILQEQNEAIALKKKQAKQKVKARRSRPKNRNKLHFLVSPKGQSSTLPLYILKPGTIDRSSNLFIECSKVFFG
ncbi:uncharacterized protein DS421_17g583000 [Arachis hypogaea]|nr:uncharacterized protein DS421_17g583000 [Arachis hypogaea]